MCILISLLILNNFLEKLARLVSIMKICKLWLLKCSKFRIEYPRKGMKTSRVSHLIKTVIYQIWFPHQTLYTIKPQETKNL